MGLRAVPAHPGSGSAVRTLDPALLEPGQHQAELVLQSQHLSEKPVFVAVMCHQGWLSLWQGDRHSPG